MIMTVAEKKYKSKIASNAATEPTVFPKHTPLFDLFADQITMKVVVFTVRRGRDQQIVCAKCRTDSKLGFSLSNSAFENITNGEMGKNTNTNTRLYLKCNSTTISKV